MFTNFLILAPKLSAPRPNSSPNRSKIVSGGIKEDSGHRYAHEITFKTILKTAVSGTWDMRH